MKRVIMLLCAALTVCAVSAAPPARTDKVIALATVASYTNTIPLSMYGESVQVDRVAIYNGTTTNATVYLEFLDNTGAESIASEQSVTAGEQKVVYPRRVDTSGTISNLVKYTMHTLRVRTTLTATNHTGTVELSVNVD